MVQQARERTRTLLTEKREQVEIVAQQLLEKEVLTRESMVALLGKRPFDIQDDMDDFLDRNKGNSKIRPEEA
jgi:AFG3 family protein